MFFNSAIFILFAATFYALWPLVRRRNNLRLATITAASFLFYGWWDWRFLFLIALSGLIDFAAAIAIVRHRDYARWMLAISLMANLGILTIFKYLDFALHSLASLTGWMGWERDIQPIGLILPVGISFYTFQSMSYTIDVYRRRLEPTTNPLHFFAYLSMFPQLVAGPIERASNLLPQLASWRPTGRRGRIEGMELIARGYFKKTVIADNLARWVDEAFTSTNVSENGWYWWIVLSMFTTQIYCDFSGYSDIARGLARWMGYRFGLNFNHPFIAVGFRDFWSRWHISLSTWFRDYVYIPLGGNRGSALRSELNMWATMLISGLWHGAAWTFILWGALNAAYLSLERLTQWPQRISRSPWTRPMGILITVLMTMMAFLLFRADSINQAGEIASNLLNLHPSRFSNATTRFPKDALALLMAFTGWHVWVLGREQHWWRSPYRRGSLTWVVVTAIILVAAVVFRGPGQAFVYFQF